MLMNSSVKESMKGVLEGLGDYSRKNFLERAFLTKDEGKSQDSGIRIGKCPTSQ